MSHPKLRENWRNRTFDQFMDDVASRIADAVGDFPSFETHYSPVVTGLVYDGFFGDEFAWKTAAEVIQEWIDTGVIDAGDPADAFDR